MLSWDPTAENRIAAWLGCPMGSRPTPVKVNWVPMGPDSGDIESIESLEGLLITSAAMMFDWSPPGLRTLIKRSPGAGAGSGRKEASRLVALTKVVNTGCSCDCPGCWSNARTEFTVTREPG